MESIEKNTGLRILAAFLILAIVLGPRMDVVAQEAEKPLNVTANFKAEEPVPPDTAIEISLSRALRIDEKVAVTIGQMDVSGLFNQSENKLTYDTKLLPLPVGSSSVTIYLIDQNSRWKEIARLSLTVLSPESKVQNSTEGAKPEVKSEEKPAEKKEAPESKTDESKTKIAEEPAKAEETEKPVDVKADEAKSETAEAPKAEKKTFFKFLPTFTISMESQPFQSNFPIDGRPEKRATFTDFNLTGSIKTEAKVGGVTNESSFDFAGSSFKEKTLQFGTLARKAPDVDLASYVMNFTVGKAKFSLGHTSFGNNRHLVNSFSSRGLSVNIPINKYLDVTGGIENGSSVLGVRNFLGMSQIRHQVQGATFGIEVFPKRKNAMRIEITGFNGYLQAVNGVSEGRVVDAERSRGFGFRFITSDKTERFKLEAGYALSRFFNAADKTLDPNGTAVVIPAVIRSAYYLDSTYQVLKDIKLTKTKNLNMSFGFKYEYVEPLYRSLGASASADKVTQDYSMDASIGEITFQAGHARSNDNLANVPSILRSLTRSNRFSVALPLAALIGKSEKPSPFLPRLGYSIDQTHNFGASIPVNGGFEIDSSTIPDLLNTNQSASSTWQFKKFNLGYTYSRSYADNLQVANQNKDQVGWVHGITVGLNPLEILSFSVGLSLDSQKNLELNQINRTKTLNLGTTWQPFKRATFTGELSQTLAGDAARTSLARNVNYSGQFAYSFSLEKSRFKKFGMQAFVRFADAFVRNRNFVDVSNTLTRTKIMTAGITMNFF